MMTEDSKHESIGQAAHVLFIPTKDNSGREFSEDTRRRAEQLIRANLGDFTRLPDSEGSWTNEFRLYREQIAPLLFITADDPAMLSVFAKVSLELARILKQFIIFHFWLRLPRNSGTESGIDVAGAALGMSVPSRMN